MRTHIVGRYEFRHLRSERYGGRRVLARLAGIIGVVVERVLAEILLAEIVVGVVVAIIMRLFMRGRRTRMRSVLEPEAVFEIEAILQIVEFGDLQIHVVSPYPSSETVSSHSRR